MTKGSPALRVLKIMSPTKLLSRKKSIASKEDLDLFEYKDADKYVDYLDDDTNIENVNHLNHMDIFQGDHRKNEERSKVAEDDNSKTNSKIFSVGKPTAMTEYDRQKSIDEIMKMINLPCADGKVQDSQDRPNEEVEVSRIFSNRRANAIDMNIGLRLAAKDKLDIMTGNTTIKEDHDQIPLSKKIMIVPDHNVFRKALSLSSKSPFKKRYTGAKSNDSTGSKPSSDCVKQDIILRTSETDPSVHQTTIPSAFELLIHARICALFEGYDTLLETRAKAGKRWFSFGDLVGTSRQELESMYFSSIEQKPQSSFNINNEQAVEGFAHSPPPPLGNPFENVLLDCKSTKSYSSLSSEDEQKQINIRRNPMRSRAMKPHPSTIRSLLECTDDLIVEGYFNETIASAVEDLESTSVQVSIFSSQQQRQFIVCYRGTIAQHAKPVRNKACYNVDSDDVNEVFQTSNILDMEVKVFDKIKELTSNNPFCDVIFTGHSFGGALALIGAVRFAESQQEITLSFHGFGIPKVGKENFRLRAHSLPNLRIIRVEHAADYYVDLPTGSWEHIGHTIVIDYCKDKKRTMVNPKSNESELVTAYATAYKFGKNCHRSNMHVRGRYVIDPRGKKTQGKLDHEMRNYLHAMEHFTHMGSQWVTSFANEFGSGIVVGDNEVRSMV